MTNIEALEIVIDIASRWGENAEEAYTRRIDVDDTDEVLKDKIGPDGDDYDLESAQEIRALWRAIAKLRDSYLR